MWQLKSSKTIHVNDRNKEVPTGIMVEPGDDIWFQVWGTIWVGVSGLRPKMPVGAEVAGSGAQPYQLRGKPGIGYFEASTLKCNFVTSNRGELYLRVGDDTPRDGNGVFHCVIQCYRDE